MMELQAATSGKIGLSSMSDAAVQRRQGVHAMLRTVVASLVFALGVGSALAPTKASARSGGFAARAGVVRPALVRPGFVPPQPAAGPVVAPFQRVAPLRRH